MGFIVLAHLNLNKRTFSARTSAMGLSFVVFFPFVGRKHSAENINQAQNTTSIGQEMMAQDDCWE